MGCGSQDMLQLYLRGVAAVDVKWQCSLNNYNGKERKIRV